MLFFFLIHKTLELNEPFELGRFPGEGNVYLLQYSCLENSMNRGAWQSIVHGVKKTQT